MFVHHGMAVIIAIPLSRPVSGTELVAAVRTVADATEHSSFHSEPVDGGQRIGQGSGFPYRQLLVAPTLDDRSVREDASYTQIVVMSHAWPGGILHVGYSDSQVVKAVRDFSEHLKQLLPCDY